MPKVNEYGDEHLLGRPLRVLLVEDDAVDAELISLALGKAGYELRAERVISAEELQQALLTAAWDIVLSDHHLPGFSSTEAFEIVRRHDQEVPFVVVSGMMPDNLAADAMWAGASDFVSKDQLARLAPAVTRVLREAMARSESRRARQQADIVEAALDINERVLAQMPVGVIVLGAKGPAPFRYPIRWANPAMLEILQCSDEMLGRPLRDALPQLVSSDLLALCEQVAVGKRGGMVQVHVDVDGVGRVLEVRIASVAPGLIAAFLGDITERCALESQMRAAQRMETVGRLAGGVSHDFNNIMTIIESYSGFVLDRLPVDDPGREDLVAISDAALRASRLTGQLLAFSRRQPQELEHLNINDVVMGLDRMLRRAPREIVKVAIRLQEGDASVRADRTQLEQVIMNLAVNACDAMPQGGRLTIETRTVELDHAYCVGRRAFVPEGRYVMLAVTDTGTGIDAETLEHVFEPFFTTKPRGKGTGLGLSTVYGVVKQSGGFVWPYSEVGVGTCIKVYLPLAGPKPRSVRRAATASLRGGSETILVAEDDDMVRTATVRILREAGYNTLVASDGAEALEVAAGHEGSIDLLLTDAVMPRLDGRSAAKGLVEVRPELEVVYMSGYTDETIDVHGTLEHGLQFLSKPFSRPQLLRKVRAALDAMPVKTVRSGTRQRIVVVEDDAPVRNAMRRLLEDEGYRVDPCATIDEALECLSGSDEPFAILCDLHVGSRSGLEVHRWLEGRRTGSADRFFLVTGGSTSQDATTFIRTHPSRVVRKPINLGELESRLAGLEPPDPLGDAA